LNYTKPRSIKYRVSSTAKKVLADLTARILKTTGGSDYRRWREIDNLSPLWDARTQKIADMIPANKAVLEFGAGRMVLAKMLKQPARYTPSDLVDRGPGTIVCDLNARPLPDFPKHDVVVFSGVLEYVNDVPSFLQHLSPRTDEVIASYAVLEKNTTGRRAGGWVNDYTAAQFLQVFEDAGFKAVESLDWENQVIHRFAKRTTS
jgi:hypothetical protein